MKKVFLLSTLLTGSLLLYKPAEAQLRIHVYINPVPVHVQYDPYWNRGNEVVYDPHYRNDAYGDRRDWDNRDWRHDHDRYDDRRYNYRHGDDRFKRDERGWNDSHGDNDRRNEHNGRSRW